MKVRVEEPTQYSRRLEITFPAAEVDASFNAVLAQVKSKVHIPGFRAGKVPTAVVLQRFRKSIEADVLSQLLEPRLPEILASNELQPVSQIQLEPGEISAGHDMICHVAFEVLPEPKIAALEELEVPVPVLPLHDADVDAKLEEMRQADAQTRTVEGRTGVIQGDVVTFDYSTTVDGAKIEDRQGVVTQIGEGRWPAEMEEALGHAVLGEAQTVTVPIPSENANKDLAGKSAQVELKVTEIKERVLPELDDDWAKDHDKDTLAELRTHLTEQLTHEKEHEREHLAEKAILDKLVELHPVEIPPSLAIAETNKRLQQLERLFSRGGSELGEEFFENLRRQTRDRAHEDIRRLVLLRSLIKQEGIEVSDEALEEKIATLAQQGQEPPAKVRARYASGEARESLRAELQEERALAFLRSKVRIVDAPEAAVAAEQED